MRGLSGCFLRQVFEGGDGFVLAPRIGKAHGQPLPDLKVVGIQLLDPAVAIERLPDLLVLDVQDAELEQDGDIVRLGREHLLEGAYGGIPAFLGLLPLGAVRGLLHIDSAQYPKHVQGVVDLVDGLLQEFDSRRVIPLLDVERGQFEVGIRLGGGLLDHLAVNPLDLVVLLGRAVNERQKKLGLFGIGMILGIGLDDSQGLILFLLLEKADRNAKIQLFIIRIQRDGLLEIAERASEVVVVLVDQALAVKGKSARAGDFRGIQGGHRFLDISRRRSR